MDETLSVCVHVCAAYRTPTLPAVLSIHPHPLVFLSLSLSVTSHLCVVVPLIRSSMHSVFPGGLWRFWILLRVVESMGFCWGVIEFSLFK